MLLSDKPSKSHLSQTPPNCFLKPYQCLKQHSEVPVDGILPVDSFYILLQRLHCSFDVIYSHEYTPVASKNIKNKNRTNNKRTEQKKKKTFYKSLFNEALEWIITY